MSLFFSIFHGYPHHQGSQSPGEQGERGSEKGLQLSQEMLLACFLSGLEMGVQNPLKTKPLPDPIAKHQGGRQLSRAKCK